MKTYVPRLPNYKNNLTNLGWSEAEFENGCSDRLVDAIVAWGDQDAIIDRIRAHHAGGADHVCVQPLARSPSEIAFDRLRDLLVACR